MVDRPPVDAPDWGTSAGFECDFGRTARDYARYRAGFPEWFFDRLAEHGIALSGRKALDLGTGTGLLARAMAQRGASVTGLDVSPEMLNAARSLDRDSGLAITYVEGRAEATRQPTASFDLVTAATCWHWFDRALAASEVMRLLVPGGAIVICSLDWLPLPGNLVSATEALVRVHSPDWSHHGGDGIKSDFMRDPRTAGLARVECFGIDCRIEYSHVDWRGRMRASAGVAASLPPERVAAFDSDLAALLVRDFPAEPLAVDHCVFAAIGWKPGAR